MSLFLPRVAVGGLLYRVEMSDSAENDRGSIGGLLVISSGNSVDNGFCADLKGLFQPRVTVGASGCPWSLPAETVLTMSVSAECAGSGR